MSAFPQLRMSATNLHVLHPIRCLSDGNNREGTLIVIISHRKGFLSKIRFFISLLSPLPSPIPLQVKAIASFMRCVLTVHRSQNVRTVQLSTLVEILVNQRQQHRQPAVSPTNSSSYYLRSMLTIETAQAMGDFEEERMLCALTGKSTYMTEYDTGS
jgi:hypothetical protein